MKEIPSMPRILTSAACLSALLFTAAMPAMAQTQYESRVVTYADLDLYAPEGADALIRRIQQAADVVCGDRSGPRNITETNSVRSCEIETTEYAINDVGHPMVMGRYYGYTPEVVIEGSWDPDADPYYEVKPQY